jgi:hypothetical protein
MEVERFGRSSLPRKTGRRVREGALPLWCRAVVGGDRAGDLRGDGQAMGSEARAEGWGGFGVALS